MSIKLMERERKKRMDIECTMTTYTESGNVADAVLRVRNMAYDNEKVKLILQYPATTDRASIYVNIVGDELISAVKQCMLDWRGRRRG